MHRLHGRKVLLDDLVEWPASNVGITLDAADESDVRIRVHEHLHVTQLAHPGVDEEENPIDDNDVRWLYARMTDASKMRDEIVLRLFDRRSPAQRFEVRT